MPEMDGYETMRRIRQDAAVPAAADHRADGEGDEGRSREMSGSRARRTTSRSPSTPISCCRCCGCGCIAEDRARHDGADKANILLVDDQPARLLSYEAILAGLGQNLVRGALGPRSAAAAHGRRFRRHPARRQHAGHGRLRDRRADPPASALRENADHLRDRGARHRSRPAERLRARRGRLRLRAGRAGDPARQGASAGRALSPAARARSALNAAANAALAGQQHLAGREDARARERSTARSRRRTPSWRRPIAPCRRRSPSASGPRKPCKRPTSARTNSSRCCRTSCAIRSRRFAAACELMQRKAARWTRSWCGHAMCSGAKPSICRA